MIKIYKYPLAWDHSGFATFEAPPGNLLKVAWREGAPGIRGYYAWIEHQTDLNVVFPYNFCLVMTGQELSDAFPQHWEYVDTLFIDWLVGHVFRKIGS